ncbi:CAP domain-containing protein [Tumidithrix elongata RA019]|uniref:CAP domain-containing protein n=1 Tax=Tumidithrix elongata BACA0141 TaxID=2716417 RepID=A0AAW9PZ80_9CYAN|nr:CAP domain-containing protein [Tumidithrix elongata RA019]
MRSSQLLRMAIASIPVHILWIAAWTATPAIARPITNLYTPIAQNTSQNAYEAELLRLTNLERQKVGLAPLKLSSQLRKAAQNHAIDMAKNNYFSHTGRNGSSMTSRIKATGYTYSFIGENIAAGGQNPTDTLQQWMNSAGHRANILNPRFTEIGFGYASAPDSRYRYYWVQVFATPRR